MSMLERSYILIQLLSAILFSFSANLDNIAIGISYGIKKTHISLFKVLMISLSTTLFTFFSMFIGKYFVYFFNDKIANRLGAYMLILIGLYTFIKDMLQKNKEKVITGINIKEFIVIILTLSTNNIATGIAASVTGINILITIIFSFIFSYLLLFLGNIIGRNIVNNYIEKYCNLFASLLLILLGIIEL